MASSYAIGDFHVGIICALPRERTAVESMLDEKLYPDINVPADGNVYTYGRIGKHTVLVASLPYDSYGTVSAAQVANDIRRTFPHVKWGLMVGIGGAMPRPESGSDDGDIRLGDVVVGCVNGVPSIVNYKSGKETSGGFDLRSELAGPPEALSRAVAALESEHQQHGPTYLFHLSHMLEKNPRLNQPKVRRDYYNMPDSPDRLFDSSVAHPDGKEDCKECEPSQVVREPRFLRKPPEGLPSENFIRRRDDDYADYPAVFIGSIGSADTLMKSARERNCVYKMVKEQRKAKLLCFEMEASGIVKNWPCLVIRGICDYSDSHKNDAWQNFAAATAAAYAKDLLLRIQPEVVAQAKPVAEVMGNEPTRDSRILHTGSGPINANFGTGPQTNYNQSGSNNRQVNVGGNMSGYGAADR